MDDVMSWLGGHDWTPVDELSPHSSPPNRHNVREFLLPAEDIFAEAQAVILVNSDVAGTLLVTNYRFLFICNDEVKELGTIPLATIEKFAKLQPPTRNRRISSRRLLQVVGKDIRVIVFAFRPHVKQRRSIFDALWRLTRPSRLWDLYAFSSDWAKSCGNVEDSRCRLRAEYVRIIAGREYWQISNVNSDYMLCPTYPSLLVMPSSLSNEEIQQAAAFRARGRLPSLCWQHPVNGAVLARSSQPLVGIMMNSRSIPDEKLVASLCFPQDQRRKLYIADARPRKNALANGAMGGGSESSANYSQCEVVYLGIDNIHSMRDSLSRLRDVLDIHGDASSDGSAPLLRSGGTTWSGGNTSSAAAAVSAFGESGWLTHIHNILAGASWIASRVAIEGASVLVHCTDGWDRTAQLVSLAEVMLDPYYRTIKGFQILVEKEWLAFGHPFAERTGFPTLASCEPVASPARGSSAQAPYGNSPIFLQWLDCVAQLLRLYPRAFEYTSAFLVDLIDAYLSCRFGNFLCNSEKERVQAGVNESSACLWTYLLRLHSREDPTNKHVNIFYHRQLAELTPSAAALAPALWSQFYLRWVFSTDSRCAPGDEIDTEARMRISRLEKLARQAEERMRDAEGKMSSLLQKVTSLEERLQAEQVAHASARAAVRRARNETSSIKHAVEAMGCEIKFSNSGGVSIKSLDSKERRLQNQDDGEVSNSLSSNSSSSSNGTHIDPVSSQQQQQQQPQQHQQRRGSPLESGGGSLWGMGRESCNWPQTGCPRLGSAMEGLVVDFDALKGISISDDYFSLDHHGGSQYGCLHAHSPGVT